MVVSHTCMVASDTDSGADTVERDDGPATPEVAIRVRWPRYVFVALVFALAIYLLRPHLAAVGTSMEGARRLRWWALILAVIAQAWSYWGSGYLLRAVLAVSGERLPMRRAIAVNIAASSVGLVAGGLVGSAAVTYRWCRSAGVRAEAAMVAGWLPSIFNSLALVGFAVLGLLQLVALHELARWQVIGVSASAAVLLLIPAVTLWGASHRSRFTALAARASAWRKRLRRRARAAPSRPIDVARLFAAWDAMRSGGWRRAVLGSVYNVGFDMLTLFLIFVAARHTVSAGVLLAGYALPVLLGRISILPGGLGILEATMITLYSGLGVPATVAILVVLSYRLLSFWLPTFIGFPLIAYLQHRL